MRPAARLQAAIELADEVIASSRDNGPPADAIVSTYFKTRRYAGSKDRRAVRELLFRAIRLCGECPDSGRAALIALANQDAELLDLFDGSAHGPAPIEPAEIPAKAKPLPDWIKAELSGLVGEEEWFALLERAPLDLRVNVAKTDRAAMLETFEGAETTNLSPWGLRLPTESRIDQSEPFIEGLVEVQDEGSQLIALAAVPDDANATVLDLCAGAGGKALAIAAAAPSARIIASDTSRPRLAQLQPRAERADATIETRLLDGGKEEAQISDLEGECDIVLVDAPCSGSGTWRRNPEGRWRLTAERLAKLVETQAHVLDLAAPLVRPGGVLVYATCSILSAEGEKQIDDFLSRHSGWRVQDLPFTAGRQAGKGRLLTPHYDQTDGFFIARLERAC